MYGKGISRSGDLIDLAVKENVVNKSGAWFNYGDQRLGQGRENVKKYLDENSALMDEIEGKIRAKYGLDGKDSVPEDTQEAAQLEMQE